MFDIRPIGVGVLIYVQLVCADLAADDFRFVEKCPAPDIRNLQIKVCRCSVGQSAWRQRSGR